MELFSRHVIGMPLYRYQLRWAQPALETIAARRNEVIVVEQPRQSGKNEGSAQLEVAVLARFGMQGGEMIKTAPTFKPQIVNSKLRFEARAAMAKERLPFLDVRPSMGYMYRCVRAGISFLSADPNASVVGATASLLLEVDEAQDVDIAKFDKDFSPMRASTGAPVLAYGTTWTDSTLLARFKRDIEDGRVKGQVIRILPEEVGEENPAYLEYVIAETRRLGRQHPLIKTQYYLEELADRGRMLSKQQLTQMLGDHERKEARTNESVIVAGLDWAGSDEDAGELASLMTASKRDSVALTVGSVHWEKDELGVWQPRVRILARYEWTNQHPTTLHSTLVDILLRKWKANKVHADGTGLGGPETTRLSASMDGGTGKRVEARTFDAAWNTQTDLAFQYLALVNGSRLLEYKPKDFDPIEVAGQETPDTKDVDRHVWWQRGHARLEARANHRVHAYVPESEGHDDLLISEMLMVDAALSLSPGLAVGVQQKKRTRIG
jgi:hypothetical protein